MALNYNLAKVYALSDNDPEFVNEILTLFVSSRGFSTNQRGNKRKIISMPMYAHKINQHSTYLIKCCLWRNSSGGSMDESRERKDIDHTFKSIKLRLKMQSKK
jgi:hypothetical protein